MDETAAICSFIRETLYRFSDRCFERLTGKSVLSTISSVSTEHMCMNVEKEIVKDCLVVQRTADALSAGAEPSNMDIDDLFERSKELDRTFIQNLILPSVSINIRYDDISRYRKKRFRYLMEFVADILRSSRQQGMFAETVRRNYTPDQFQGFIGEYLFLYCIEVKQLADSVRFLPPFSRAMNNFIDELVEAMELSRQEVAGIMTNYIFSVNNAQHIDHRQSSHPFSGKQQFN